MPFSLILSIAGLFAPGLLMLDVIREKRPAPFLENLANRLAAAVTLSMAMLVLPSTTIGVLQIPFVLAWFILYDLLTLVSVCHLIWKGRHGIARTARKYISLAPTEWAIVVLFALLVLRALVQPLDSNYDALAWYIPDAKTYLQYSYIPVYSPWYPDGVESVVIMYPFVPMLFAWILSIPTMASIDFQYLLLRVPSLLVFGLTIILVREIARVRLGDSWRNTAGLLVFSPIFLEFFTNSSLYGDVFMLFFSLLALHLVEYWTDTGSSSESVLMGLLAGITLALILLVKVTGLFVLAAVGLVLTISYRRRPTLVLGVLGLTALGACAVMFQGNLTTILVALFLAAYSAALVCFWHREKRRDHVPSEMSMRSVIPLLCLSGATAFGFLWAFRNLVIFGNPLGFYLPEAIADPDLAWALELISTTRQGSFFFGYNYYGNHSLIPFLDPWFNIFLLPFRVAGLAYALRKLQMTRHIIVGLSFFVMWLVFSEPQFTRHLTPVLIALVALDMLGLKAITERLSLRPFHSEATVLLTLLYSYIIVAGALFIDRWMFTGLLGIYSSIFSPAMCAYAVALALLGLVTLLALGFGSRLLATSVSRPAAGIRKSAIAILLVLVVVPQCSVVLGTVGNSEFYDQYSRTANVGFYHAVGQLPQVSPESTAFVTYFGNGYGIYTQYKPFDLRIASCLAYMKTVLTSNSTSGFVSFMKQNSVRYALLPSRETILYGVWSPGPFYRLKYQSDLPLLLLFDNDQYFTRWSYNGWDYYQWNGAEQDCAIIGTVLEANRSVVGGVNGWIDVPAWKPIPFNTSVVVYLSQTSAGTPSVEANMTCRVNLTNGTALEIRPSIDIAESVLRFKIDEFFAEWNMNCVQSLSILTLVVTVGTSSQTIMTTADAGPDGLIFLWDNWESKWIVNRTQTAFSYQSTET